ncbi:hypothetical protein LLE49_24585 [Alicyclobacillus tolerans]|uniref:hypothetical protein n=1 Tax=Alicyclobacillus tolerans TaxID=90970 RepID=UPI001F44BD50|nr:hypothetical protein [Alicyclobacillus tolerans]MCF8567904.1 hypothetical protein [Alicyclobacillus tolerans]
MPASIAGPTMEFSPGTTRWIAISSPARHLKAAVVLSTLGTTSGVKYHDVDSHQSLVTVSDGDALETTILLSGGLGNGF